MNQGPNHSKRILQIGNWPPPLCSWTMNMVGLRRELEARGWDCAVMNLNENRRVKNPEYIDVQDGWDYFRKVLGHVVRGYAVHVRVNGETKKGYLLALAALQLARLFGRPALLTYGGGHIQSYLPAPKGSFRHLAYSFLFRFPHQIYCNSEKVKQVLLTTGVREDIVLPIPNFSAYYLDFTPVALPTEVEDFYRKHTGVFFSYVCFRKEYALEFFSEAIRRFRTDHPDIGFMLVGPRGREMEPMQQFLKAEKLEEGIYVLGSVPHDMFLTLMTRSLAYIRTPITDGVCSSVLEALQLKVPVLGSDNDARPLGTELWKEGDLASLVKLMEETLNHHDEMVERIPELEISDNASKQADTIEELCLSAYRG
jgi:glycosyltransferase involved in cell wall biosynthesis